MLRSGRVLPALIGACNTRYQLITSLHTLRCNNVTTLTVHVLQQGDVRATVWIVFQTLNNSWNAVFVALEIDNTVVLLVTTTNVTGSDTASIVTTTGLVFFSSRGA